MDFNYSMKLLIAVSVSIIGLYFSYHFGIRRSVILIKDYNKKQAEIGIINSAPKTLSSLRAYVDSLDNTYGMFSEDMRIQERLLDKIDDFDSLRQTIMVDELSEPIFKTIEDYQLYQQEIVLQGQYKTLLSYLRNLENDYSIGKICSVEFYSENDRKSKREYLYMKLHVQSIMK